MSEELIRDWENFKLTDEENTILGATSIEDTMAKSTLKLELSLVGKMLTMKPYNIDAMMKRVLKGLWRLSDDVAVRVIDSNLFVFQFFNEEDKMRVLDGRPWTFDKQILLLKAMEGDEQPSEVVFENCPFWVRVLDVQFGRRNEAFAREVGDAMGGFLEYDEEDPLGWNEFMRIKVMLDITKPLRRGIKVATGPSMSKWVSFKYERLGDFRYFCGRLGHLDKDCLEQEKVDEERSLVFQYGPFMVASPHQRPRVSLIYREKEKRWVENLSNVRHVRRMSYNNPNAIKVGPPSAARKLSFTPTKAVMPFVPKAREATLVAMARDSGWKVVLRPVAAGTNMQMPPLRASRMDDVETKEDEHGVMRVAEDSRDIAGGEKVGTGECQGEEEVRVDRENVEKKALQTDFDGVEEMDTCEYIGLEQRSAKRKACDSEFDVDNAEMAREKRGRVSHLDISFNDSFQVEGLGNYQALEKP
uniref:CCHC-type domain-containing protein n=1 Tax=Chenopodium quinoa TaxID=63459 RepID=A0A803LK12_CHEQI